jgi:hypothetical protein
MAVEITHLGAKFTMTKLKPKQQAFIDLAKSVGMTNPMSRDDMKHLRENHGMSFPSWIMRDDSRRTGRGLYSVPELDGADFASTPKPKNAVAPAPTPVAVQSPVVGAVESTVSNIDMVLGMTGGERQSLVPAKSPEFVKWGHYSDIKKIIQSRKNINVFITGLSGNGKTFMVEQVCADCKRECYRVNLTRQTDEDDLLGGFRLINGNTVWQDGPVTVALKTGGVLLLDEVDLASHNIMCLQSVLEGKGVFLKKIGQWITPAAGFTVFATANTKGKGSDDGRFVGTGVMNEAFLDRFPITMEQPYATKATEKKILTKAGCVDADFADNLTKWAEIIRKTFYEGGIDEVVSTRRLVNIVEAFGIFGDKRTALDMCMSRFDDLTKKSLIDLYEKVDADMPVEDETAVSADGNKCPF